VDIDALISYGNWYNKQYFDISFYGDEALFWEDHLYYDEDKDAAWDLVLKLDSGELWWDRWPT